MLGTQVRKRRQELGLTQKELAERLGYTSRSTINKIELGINDVPLSKLENFAKVLKVPVAWLLELDDVDKKQRIAALMDKLDTEDIAKIEERITVMLEADKYQ